MGLETRIGIVTGLVIVVIASVYFYYGQQSVDEAAIFATTPPTPARAEPGETPIVLKIPPSAEPAVSPLERSVQAAPAQVALSTPRPEGLRTGSAAPGVRATPANPALTPLRTQPSPELKQAAEANVEDSPLDPIQLGEGLDRSEASPRQPAIVATPPSGAPGSPWPKQHTLAAGDTLAGLAQQYYRDEGEVGRIIAANPSLGDARSLKIGAVVIIPAPAEGSGQMASPSPQSASVRQYTVQPGDTLYSIAASQYQQGTRWKEILRANADLLRNDPRRLKPGMVLRVP